jgi:hypothetical protein
MATKTVTLDSPITFEGKQITELNVRSPKLKEVREMERIAKEAAGGGMLDDAVGVILLLTDIPPGAVEEMDTTDIAAISETIEGFFPKARA